MNSRLVTLAAALALFAGAAQAQTAGTIEVSSPWARATPKGASVGSGYLKITNKGSAPDRLTGGAADVAGKVEIHEMTTIDGVMRMRPIANGMEIKPGQTVELKPGGNHVMFMGLKQPLQAGQKVKGTLTFEKAGTVEVEFAIGTIGASTAPAAGGHHHH